MKKSKNQSRIHRNNSFSSRLTPEDPSLGIAIFSLHSTSEDSSSGKRKHLPFTSEDSSLGNRKHFPFTSDIRGF